jgi:hypothetical protein
LASYTLLNPTARIRGTLTNAAAPGLTFWDSPYNANVARSHVDPRRQRNARQDTARIALNLSLKQWQRLDAPTRAAWDLAATAYVRTNPIGHTYTLSGSNLWASVNQYRRLCQNAPTNVPPANLSLAPPDSVEFGTYGLQNFHVTWSHSYNALLYVRISKPWTATARHPRRSEYHACNFLFEAPLVFVYENQPHAYAIILDDPTIAYPQLRWLAIRPLSIDYVPGPQDYHYLCTIPE